MASTSEIPADCLLHLTLFHPGKPPPSPIEDDDDDEDEEDWNMTLNRSRHEVPGHEESRPVPAGRLNRSHRTRTFQQEYPAFLKQQEHSARCRLLMPGLGFDDKYLWD
jgi:hypothetical protein